MKIEKLKKSHKKKMIIGGLIGVSVLSVLIFATTKAKYQTAESINIAKGTINYKPYDFKIMAMYQQENNGNYKEISTMPSSGYIINESKSYCTKDNVNKDNNAILKTINGEHIIKNLSKSDKCYLYFDKIKVTNVSELIANSHIHIGTPDFSKVATTDEGIYQASDGMYGGVSYYWRGAVTDNYVKFGGFCWRIIRINGDGSLRLIYDGSTCHENGTNTSDSIAVAKQVYNKNISRSEYVGWTYTEGQQRPTSEGTSSNAKEQLENWYSTNLASYSEKIADGKYCNDRNVSNATWESRPSYIFYYTSQERKENLMPSLNCTNTDIYTLKIGLITLDEMMYAGGKYETTNASYYLYNGQAYWTISPLNWSYSTNIYPSAPFMFIMYSSGSIGRASVNDSFYSIRPVINLKSDIVFSSGDGTIGNPYVVG